MLKKIIFPGTFNPFTIGHLDVAKRAAGLFDRLIIAVTEETSKPGVLPARDRAALIGKCVGELPNVEVKTFNGLLVEFCKKENARLVVRGIRSFNDFQYENTMLFVNKKLAPEIETLYMMASQEYGDVSGSAVRDLIRLKADISAFVPPEIKDDLLRLYER
ncbi:MAG: pantetheine-phosphate adenylyltransferase [Clostridiales bacterium]|jgi:pantetheine-phosphate adenylyltransferase|nr:pantetheine-phosphate adenylyltransferase [Clostridiales bacterium]